MCFVAINKTHFENEEEEEEEEGERNLNCTSHLQLLLVVLPLTCAPSVGMCLHIQPRSLSPVCTLSQSRNSNAMRYPQRINDDATAKSLGGRH